MHFKDKEKKIEEKKDKMKEEGHEFLESHFRQVSQAAQLLGGLQGIFSFYFILFYFILFFVLRSCFLRIDLS